MKIQQITGIKFLILVLVFLFSLISINAYTYNLNISSTDLIFYQYYDNETLGNAVPIWTINGAMTANTVIHNGTAGNSVNKTGGTDNSYLAKTTLFGSGIASGNFTYEFDYYAVTISSSGIMFLYTGGTSSIRLAAISPNQDGLNGDYSYFDGSSYVNFNPSKDYITNTWEHMKVTCVVSTKNCSIQFNNNGSWANLPYRIDVLDNAIGFGFNQLISKYFIDNLVIYVGNSVPTVAGAETTPPLIQFVSQNPSDINFSNVVNNKLNIVYNITDTSGINLTSILLYYKANSTTSNIHYFQNGTAFSGFFTDSARTNISSMFNWTLLDNEVHQGTFNTGPVSIDTINHSITTTLSNLNDYIRTEYYNISKSKDYGFFEIMSNSTASAKPSSVYYCNSSYTTGNILTDTNCVLLNTKTAATTYSHCHSNLSCHNTFIFAINTTSGTIGSVGVTPESYFIFGGAKNWNIYSINEITRQGMTKSTASKGVVWSNETYTIDQHIHQFNSNESSIFWYYACANDTLGNNNCSILINDTMAISILGPTATTILSPTNTTYKGDIWINYTAVLSPSNITIGYYVIDLLNNDFTFNSTIVSNNSLNLSYLWNSGIVYGNYIIRVKAVDVLERTSYGYSEIFYINNINISISDFYFDSDSIYKLSTNTFNTNITTNYFINNVWATLKYPNGTSVNYSMIFNTNYYLVINDTSQLGQYNITYIFADTTSGYLNYTSFTANQYLNFSVLQPLFNLISLSSNCSFSNCSFIFTYDQTCDMNLTINSILYNRTNNTIFSITTNILSENTAYVYTYRAKDIYGNFVSGTGNIATSSYSELLYEDSLITKEYFKLYFILAFLLILYIVSEIFRIEMLGVLSGIGLIIFSFVLLPISNYIFIITLFAGVVIFARSVLAWLW